MTGVYVAIHNVCHLTYKYSRRSWPTMNGNGNLGTCRGIVSCAAQFFPASLARKKSFRASPTSDGDRAVAISIRRNATYDFSGEGLGVARF